MKYRERNNVVFLLTQSQFFPTDVLILLIFIEDVLRMSHSAQSCFDPSFIFEIKPESNQLSLTVGDDTVVVILTVQSAGSVHHIQNEPLIKSLNENGN